MTVTYFATSSSAEHENAGCSGVGAATSTTSRLLGGSAGGGSSGPGNSNTSEGWAIVWESDAGVPGATQWNAGTATVEINVTSGNTSLQWRGVYLCRVDASGSNIEVWGSLTGLTTAIDTNVHSFNVSVAELTTSSSDRLMVIFTIAHTTGHGGSTFTYTYNADSSVTVPDFGAGGGSASPVFRIGSPIL